MSKIAELQKAQAGYEAARIAIENAKPPKIQKAITYDFTDPNTEEKKIIQAGYIGYEPSSNIACIILHDKRAHLDREVYFVPEVIPALIKALQEFVE